MHYDAIVVGSGLSGAVFARQCAQELNWKILILERRNHIGGNCFDTLEEGIIVHPYGPHLFHTDKKEVIDFVNRFSGWVPYHHKVRVHIDDKIVPLPINLDAISTLFPPQESADIISTLIDAFPSRESVSVFELQEHSNPIISRFGDYVFKNIFLNYTVKQWGIAPSEINRDVLKRVPIRLNDHDGYFEDPFQMMPNQGFTPFIEAILEHPNITVQTGVDAMKQLKIDENHHSLSFNNTPYAGKVIYTGMLDELFAYRFGPLPYRSLQFDFKTLPLPVFQEATTHNYPNAEGFTRITEFKHIYNTPAHNTIITYEFPCSYEEGKNLPYYPLFTESSQNLYQHYKEFADTFPNLIIAGRLAEYRYYDMDDAIENALQRFQELRLSDDLV